MAKKSESIAFFKIENDGFGLGAQRREIDKNDLPQVLTEIGEYLCRLRAGESVEDFQSMLGLIVEKEKIAANGEYNLSGERYGDQTRLLQSKWPTVSLGEICTFMTGGTPTSTVAEYYENGTVPWLVSGDIHGFKIWDCEKRITPKAVENSNARVLPKDSVLIALNGQGKTRGTVALLRMEGATCNQSLVAIMPLEPLRAISEFIFWVLRSMYSDIRALTGDNERSGLNIPILKSILIPLPPLEVQKVIVAEVEGYQKIINGARAVLDNYRPHIPIHPNWPMVELGELVDELESGVSVNSTNRPASEGEFGILKTSCVTCGVFDPNEHKSVLPEEHARLRCPVRGNTIIISRMNTEALVGANAFVPQDYPHLFLPDRLWQTVISRSDVEVLYLQTMLASADCREKISALCGGTSGSMKNISKPQLLSLRIPLPSLDTQQTIVAEIEAEQALVNANRELIARFEKKIQATLDRVWGEDDPSPAEA
jgi:type I restriction enzyme M protein